MTQLPNHTEPVSGRVNGIPTAALLVVIVWGLANAGAFLIPLSVSALLAFLMAPAMRAMRRMRMPEWLAISISAITLTLPIFALAYALVAQTRMFVRDFPRILATLNTALVGLADTWLGQALRLRGEVNISDLVEKAGASIEQSVAVALSGVTAVLGATTSIAMVILFAVLMLAARARLRVAGERILAPRHSIYAVKIIDEASALVERFLVARLFIVLLVSLADYVILRAFDLNYSLLLAIFLGLMTMIPAIGFILSAIPPIIVGFATGDSTLSVIVMTACLAVIALIEGNVMTPRMVGRRLNLNALSTFVGLFAGALLWGVPGMLLSLPVLAVMRVGFMAAPSLRPWGELLSTDDQQVSRLPQNKREAA